MKCGLIYARHNGARSIVTIDSDGQHGISEVSLLLSERDGYKVTIGVREQSTYRWGKTRKFAHSLLNWIVSKTISQKITDSTSGFRLLRDESIDLAIQLLDDDYLDDSALLLVRLGRNGLKINETTVKMNQRREGKPSQSKGKLLLHYLSVVLRIFLERRKKWS